LSGYAAIRARLAFLMGSDRKAADDAIQVLRDTHARARDCFDLSLSALVLCASALVVANLKWYTSMFVIGIFLCFLADGARFKWHIDGKLVQWTSRANMLTSNDPAVNIGCGRCFSGAMVLLRWCCAPGAPSTQTAGAAGPGALRTPNVARMDSTPKLLRSYLYKTPSRDGPLNRPPSRPTHRRFFVLKHRTLSIYASQDRADLSPAYQPSHMVHLADYTVHNVHQEVSHHPRLDTLRTILLTLLHVPARLSLAGAPHPRAAA